MTLENAARLTELRHSHGLSQEELAEKLGVSRQAISKWERAESSPDTDNLIALAQLYGVSLDVLLGLQLPDADDVPAAEYEAPAEESEPSAAEEAAPPEEAPCAPSAEDSATAAHHRRHSFPYPMAITAIYLLLGFCLNWWHPGWILFLTVPLFYLPEHERTPLRLLGNPVMVTIIYLLLGFECGWWHPGWLVFFLIPLLNVAGRR